MAERFGNYDLLEKIAVGGMAEIFKARATHGHGVEKVVCIKRIHPALSADRNFVAMFLDEARLGVTMVHGNIVPVFDFGYVDGHYFLAMEYVAGQDLATFCGRARVVGKAWPREVAIYVVMEVLEGLSYAHQKRDDQGRPLDLVHRDVSPSNILISDDGQVKLLDFGIARSQAREYETRTGVIKGKPGYMSPEQAAGMAVDARADVWSCGAVLFELLAGGRLKDGRRRIGEERLDALLDRALSADREKRFQSARHMQDALSEILVAWGKRPGSEDLARFIREVKGATAPGENWDMSSTAVERHLAAALASRSEERLASATTETQEPPRPIEKAAPEPSLPTRRLGQSRKPSVRRRIAIAAVSAAAAAAALGAVAIRLNGSGSGERLSTAGPTRARVVNHGVSAPSPASTGALAEMPSQLPDRPPDKQPARTDAAQVPVGSATPTGERRKPVAWAEVSINSQPWSNVLIDGKPVGTTPIKDMRVVPGRHKVVLTNPVKNLTRTVVFSLKPGEKKIIGERLEP